MAYQKKMQHIHQNSLEEVNVNPKISMCSDFWQKNFDVLRSEIMLNKVYLECEDTVKSKPNGNDSDFITYWKKTNFTGKWLDNSGYIIIYQ